MITDVQQHDYYQVLGLLSNPTQKEIDQAYQKLIAQFDSSAVADADEDPAMVKEKIALVQEAYDTLSNEEKREAYDKQMQEERNDLPDSPAQVAREVERKLLAGKQAEADPERKQNIYRDFFGFAEKPFDLTPNPKYLYLSPKHKEVLAHLVYGLQENNGFLKIIGEVGTGKTTICRSFLKELHADLNIAYIFNPCIDELELLQTINAELGLPDESTSRKKLIDILNAFLLKQRKKGNRVVVIIDEAQDLQPVVLEQLRLLSNLETDTEKLIQIVLIGQPELDALLDRKELRQLRQRITISWELLALNLEETRGYIQHRLNVALGKGKVGFARPALELIYKYSRGTPRMINVIADRSLLIAYTRNTKKITPRIVRAAIRDIGGLIPLATWADTLLKSVLPALAGAALLYFAVNHFVLPDLNRPPVADEDIREIIKANPMDLSDPGELIPQTSNVEEETALESMPFSPTEKLTMGDASMVVVGSPPRKENKALQTPARHIPSVGPLVISQSEKIVTYLSSLSLVESKVEAVKWILNSWGIPKEEVRALEASSLDYLQEKFELSQYELNANLNRLMSLGYPAILEIVLPNSQGTKYIALNSIKDGHGLFGSVDQIEMPLDIIDPLWSRKAIILWKDFEDLPKNFASGYKGKEAVWLQKNLRLLGFFQGMEAPLYGDKTVKSVQQFQRKHNIKDDGKFHTESKMLLYNLLSIYKTPQLQKQ